MNATIVYDRELMPDAAVSIGGIVKEILSEREFETEEIIVGRDDLKPCMGCFSCWIKTPGQCVIVDGVEGINRKCMQSDAVFYLCPVVFGQFSANMKCVIDRWLPNMLPFFTTRPDGSTMHPPRYEDYPKQVMIGFAEDLTEEDATLFSDITKKHRTGVEVLIWRNDPDALREQLLSLSLKRQEGCL